MIIELHLIQNFAPSCLNRDDTGMPKDCVFGGVRRARISSQCIKRAIRMQSLNKMLPEDNRAIRTKRLLEFLTRKLTESGKDAEESAAVAAKAIEAAVKAVDKNGKTPYLLYLGKQEIERVMEVILDRWDDLKGKKKADKEVTKAFQEVLDGGKEIGRAHV